VHHDVALAIGGAAAIPPPARLGQLKRRSPPLGLVQRRLDVVVRVEQDGRRIRVRARPGPEHRLAPVRHLRQPAIGEADAGKSVPHPPRRPGAFFRRELAGVSHRPDRHQLGQLGPRLPHQARDAFTKCHDATPWCRRTAAGRRPPRRPTARAGALREQNYATPAAGAPPAPHPSAGELIQLDALLGAPRDRLGFSTRWRLPSVNPARALAVLWELSLQWELKSVSFDPCHAGHPICSKRCLYLEPRYGIEP
jgi:hypothetical protein